MRHVKFIKVVLLLVVPLALLLTLLVSTTGAISFKVYVVHTESMSPTIVPGSAVIVHEGHFQIGQVITFVESGQVVTHRLVSISNLGLITTKGDANPTTDPWHVPKGQIIGGVVAAPRYVGYWITYVKNPAGFGSFLLLFFALWQIWSLISQRSSDATTDDHPARQRVRKSARGNLAVRPRLLVTSGRTDAMFGEGDIQSEPAWGQIMSAEGQVEPDIAQFVGNDNIDDFEHDNNYAAQIVRDSLEPRPTDQPTEISAAEPSNDFGANYNWPVEPDIAQFVGNDNIDDFEQDNNHAAQIVRDSLEPHPTDQPTEISAAEPSDDSEQDNNHAAQIVRDSLEPHPTDQPTEISAAEPSDDSEHDNNHAAQIVRDSLEPHPTDQPTEISAAEPSDDFEHDNNHAAQTVRDSLEPHPTDQPTEIFTAEAAPARIEEEKPAELAEPGGTVRVDEEERRHARMAKLFGVVQNGTDSESHVPEP
jgi:signal peptidase